MAGPSGWPKEFNVLSSSPRSYSFTSSTVRTPVYTAIKGLFTWWWGTPQWRIQGRGPGGLSPPDPLFLDQTELRRAEKKFFWRPAPPLSQGLDDRPPSLIWRSGSATAPGKWGNPLVHIIWPRLHDRWVDPPHVTFPIWGPPPQCKQALRVAETHPICDDPVAASLRYRNRTVITVLMCEQKPYPMVLVQAHLYPIQCEHITPPASSLGALFFAG